MFIFYFLIHFFDFSKEKHVFNYLFTSECKLSQLGKILFKIIKELSYNSL